MSRGAAETASPAQRAGVLANVAGAVLVGGASTRMGRDKARIEIDGIPLVTRTARLLADLCEDVLIVGGDVPVGSPGRAVGDPPDSEAPRCALRGLVAALEAASAERVLVVATDMPYLSLDVLAALIAWPEKDAVVVRDGGGRLHPLCGLYQRDRVLEAARSNLQARRYALAALLDDIEWTALEGADLAAVDADGRALTNLNTAEDLQAMSASS